MPVVRIHSAAADESEAAVDWYESERPGLGRRFQRVLDAGLALLESGTAPAVTIPGPLGEAGVKRLVLRRFPYDIVFFPRENEITVLAFAHHSRRPAYWRHRLRR